MLKWIILAVVILALIALVLANIRVVPQSKAFVLERLGTFYATWQTGLHVKIPFIDRIAKTVSLKEQVVDFKPQAVITKDNVTMQIDTVVFFQITDPKLYTYGVESPISAIENLSDTSVRTILGEMELDSTLTSRDTINTKVAKVSIVGAGMASAAGVASKMFEALAGAGINIRMISTSEIKISVLINEEDSEKAVKAIHDQFFGD